MCQSKIQPHEITNPQSPCVPGIGRHKNPAWPEYNRQSAECVDRSKHRNTSYLDVEVNVTSFDARWKTDSKVDQPAQRTEHSECYSKTIHTCESLLHYAVMLRQNAQVCTQPNMCRLVNYRRYDGS